MSGKNSAVIVIDGNTLTLAQVIRVARDRAPAELLPLARERMARTNKVVRGIVERGETVYGVRKSVV